MALNASRDLDHNPDQHPDLLEPGFTITALRALGVAAFLAMAAFWIWAFAFRGIGTDHPDELNLPASSEAADLEAASPDQLAALRYLNESETICAEAQSRISELPFAAGAESFTVRAGIIDDATVILQEMVNDLGRVDKPTEANENFIATEWVKDYNQFLDDRRGYSDILRSGDDPPFEISARDGRRVTDYIVNFAEVNRMLSCIPPGDVG